MKQISLLMMATMMLTFSNEVQATSSAGEPLIGKNEIKIDGQRLTPEALWAMGRIGDFDISPDGKQIAYTVAYYSVPQNKSNREVFVMNADGSNNRQITHTPYQENGVKWIKGGTKLAFLSNDDGSSQLYEMNADGSARTKISSYNGDLDGFKISPDGKKILFVAQVKTVKS